MFAIIGIVLIFVMVFGGYILAGGKLGIILKALPFEMMMIGGAAAGTFLISNGSSTIGGRSRPPSVQAARNTSIRVAPGETLKPPTPCRAMSGKDSAAIWSAGLPPRVRC
jgi:hypothetical protein